MNDYQAGLRHNLEIIEVFDENFKMGDLVEEYKGMDLLDARKAIVEKLKEIGALVKEEKYIHNVGKCERCKNTIEPKISDQWFVKMEELAKPAIEAVKSGEIKFIPKKYEKLYFNWMENIQDWCISRQLWWGHRIPAYYCEKCGHINVSKTQPEKCEKCGSTELYQDEDTLDTWFSSALWPFSTLGWPNKESEDYKMFYPTNTLVTGYDIITFWVSRMITSGLECTKQKPFSDVLIHGMVRDSQGRKMSKTLGNGIDPMDIIEQYGADSLRYSVISGTTMGNDIKYMPEKLEQASNFANKIWNAAKFIMMNMVSKEEICKFGEENYNAKANKFKPNNLKLEDKWILNKLDKLVKEVTVNIENYDLGIALDKICNFIWNEFCDWYIEIVKPRLYSENKEEKISACYILSYVFKISMKLLHPFMPFVTTKIYDELMNLVVEKEEDKKELIIAEWPKAMKEANYEEAEKTMENLKDIIVEIRNIRATKNIHPSKKANLIFVTQKFEDEIWESKEFLMKLGFGEKIIVQSDKIGIPENAISILGNDIQLYMPLEGLINLEEEKERREKEKQRLESEVARCEKMLSNPGFINKAPAEKIEEEKEKLRKYKEMLENL